MRPSPARLGRALLVVALVAVAAFAGGPTAERTLLGKAPPSVTTISDVGQLAAAVDPAGGPPGPEVIFSPPDTASVARASGLPANCRCTHRGEHPRLHAG